MSTESGSGGGASSISLPLDRLGLSIGHSLIVETLAGKRRLHSRLIGYVKGATILIEPPTIEGREAKLEKSETISVRGMVGNQAFAFSTSVSYCGLQPYRHYHLNFPKETVVVEVRKNARVAVDLPALVESEFDVGIGDWPKAATIQDISPQGAGLLTRQMLGENSHEIILKFNIQVAGKEKSIHAPAVIRNCVVVDKPTGSFYIFGTEFGDLNDETRLAITSYLYEIQSQGTSEK